MTLRRRDLLALMGSSAVGLSAADALATGHVVRRNVAIIGGGSAGTYAALRLRDQGKSVVILERSERLGGHAETYRDPGTGAPIDIGVIIFPDIALVRNYFARFGVPLINPPQGGGGSSKFVDFRTGAAVDAFNPSPAELGAALQTYFQLVTGPFAFLAQSGYQLPESGPLLDQLLLPFGKFAEQHGLKALLPLFFLYAQGFGTLLETPAVYILKNLGPEVMAGILTGAFVVVPTGVGSLYDAATEELASDVLFGASVVKVIRPTRGPVSIITTTASGPKLIQADKVLFTAPPTTANLCVFDLDPEESRIFGRFNPNHYFTAVVETQGLAPDLSLVNAAAKTPANLAPLPGIYSVSPSPIPGLTNVKFGSDTALSDRTVRSAIRSSLERVKLPGVGPISVDGFATFKSHSPFALMVSPADIRRGFYKSLENLQGRRKTFYAGATFQTHSSASIWAYIEELLPRLSA